MSSYTDSNQLRRDCGHRLLDVTVALHDFLWPPVLAVGKLFNNLHHLARCAVLLCARDQHGLVGRIARAIKIGLHVGGRLAADTSGHGLSPHWLHQFGHSTEESHGKVAPARADAVLITRDEVTTMLTARRPDPVAANGSTFSARNF